MSWRSSPAPEFDAFSAPATTCWGLLRQCASPEPAQAAEALAAVCQRYRPAVLAYLRGRTSSPHDAQDLTQGFFVHALERGLFLRADPAQGRFRAFLFVCLQRYLNGEADRQRAAKRGGGVVLLPLAELMEEGRDEVAVSLVPAHVHRRAEEARFDRRWAATLLDGVLDQLQAECRAAHGADVFGRLLPFLAGGAGENGAEEHGYAAAALGLGLATFRSFLHRWRARHRTLIRAAVAQTLADPADTDAEVRHLVAALASGE